MFAKPELGSSVKVTTDWSNYFKMFAEHVCINRNQNTIYGTVVESIGKDDPNSFRLLTRNSTFPVSVIELDRVVELSLSDGTELDKRKEVDQVDEETWEVPGTKGSYIVTRKDNKWNCECKGWQFRSQCKHVNEKKQEMIDKS